MANYVLYGVWQQKDITPTTPASSIDADLLIGDVQETLDSHNQEINTTLGLFCAETTNPTRKYRSGANAFLQPVDEYGDPKPIKGGATYSMGFPIKMGGTAAGSNFVTHAKMTIADFDAQIAQQLRADVNWMRRHMLAALFYNGSGYVHDDPTTEDGSVTVLGGANGDSFKYVFNNTDDAAVDTHYARQADAIDASHNPLPTIQNELTEHPENEGPFILFVAPGSANSTGIQALAGFVEVSTAQIATPAEDEDRLDATLGVVLPRNSRVIGAYGQLWIVEWGAIPTDYMVGLATGGQRPLMRRQDPEPELQGFINPVSDRMDRFPFFSSKWLRRTGFGAFNRVGVFVQQVTAASTTYAIPSGFDPSKLP